MKIDLFKTRISEESISNVAEVLRSGWIGLGPKTAEFEKAFAEYVGAKYCVGLNSCTSALHLAVRLLNAPEGSEIITTPMTFVSTNEAILYERLKPIFVDVERGTLNIDVTKIEAAITKKTVAILCVHFAGQPCDLEEIYRLAKRYNIKVIEDAAHACGASYHGKKIGSDSELACFSFHAVKNLPMGDGGAITTNNKKYYDELLKLRWLGINKSTFSRSEANYKWKYDVDILGYKYHMNDITAAIGLGQLKTLDKENRHRQKLVDIYTSLLYDSNLEIPEYKYDRTSSNHIFHIKVEDREKLMNVLADNGIGSGVHYYPNHLYKLFGGGELPITEEVYGKIISLPLHTYLTEKDIVDVCNVIKSEVDY